MAQHEMVAAASLFSSLINSYCDNLTENKAVVVERLQSGRLLRCLRDKKKEGNMIFCLLSAAEAPSLTVVQSTAGQAPLP